MITSMKAAEILYNHGHQHGWNGFAKTWDEFKTDQIGLDEFLVIVDQVRGVPAQRPSDKDIKRQFAEFLTDLAELTVEDRAAEALRAAREYIAEDNNPKSNRVLQMIRIALDDLPAETAPAMLKTERERIAFALFASIAPWRSDNLRTFEKAQLPDAGNTVGLQVVDQVQRAFRDADTALAVLGCRSPAVMESDADLPTAADVKGILGPPPAGNGDLRERVAINLWHRFAPEGHIEWSEERYQAEYLDAADAVLFLTRSTAKANEPKTASCERCNGSGHIREPSLLSEYTVCPDCDGNGYLELRSQPGSSAQQVALAALQDWYRQANQLNSAKLYEACMDLFPAQEPETRNQSADQELRVSEAEMLDELIENDFGDDHEARAIWLLSKFDVRRK